MFAPQLYPSPKALSLVAKIIHAFGSSIDSFDPAPHQCALVTGAFSVSTAERFLPLVIGITSLSKCYAIDIVGLCIRKQAVGQFWGYGLALICACWVQGTFAWSLQAFSTSTKDLALPRAGRIGPIGVRGRLKGSCEGFTLYRGSAGFVSQGERKR